MRTLSYVLLTILGAAVLAFIEFVDNLSKMVKLPALICGGSAGV